tara:strand:+ start:261 stop:665 length:405 start_codon:yes stop_codon:yes gene_type:complete
MNNVSYTIVKLTNGEDIICELEEKSKSVYEIQNPLQIITTRDVQNGGVQESLSLGRWCHPFTDQTYFSIPVDAVVTTAKASPGLSKYYEYILKRTEQRYLEDYNREPTDEELEEIDMEVEEEFLSLEGPSNKIH